MRDQSALLRTLLLATVASTAMQAQAAHGQLNPAPAAQAGTSDAIRVLLDQANYFRSKNQPKQAAEALDRVLSLDLRNADALALRAQAAAEAGEAPLAQTLLGRLLLIRPDDPRIESIRLAMLMDTSEQTELADARRLSSNGRFEEAVAAYRRLFHGELPAPALAAEFYRALGNTQATWTTTRDALSARLRANPQDLKAQIAFAELLAYHEATREMGVERLRRLAQNSGITNQVNLDLRQADPPPAAERATTTAEPRPHSSTGEAPSYGPVASAVAAAAPLAELAGVPLVIASLALAQDNAPAPEQPGYAPPGPAPVAAARRTGVAAVAPSDEPVTRDYERYAQYVPQADLSAPPAGALARAASVGLPSPPAPLVSEPDFSGSSPIVNPFRVASAPTPDEPRNSPSPTDAPSLGASADPLTADIDRSIQQVSADVAPRLDASLGFRGRSGTPGLGQLFDVEAPIEASFSPNGYGRLKVTVTPVGLVSGTPGGTDKQLFGTNPLNTSGVFGSGGSQKAAGAALNVAYAYGPLSADVGSTPIGFRETNVVGGVQYAPRLSNNLVLRLTAERRAVTDSLLSYGGQRDPQTGQAWGGVTRNRLYAQFEQQVGPYTIYYGAGGAGLYGDKVQSNSELEAGAGFTAPVWTTPTQEVRAGTTLVYFGYNRNLGNYTVGQGGYFSPQMFMAALFPVTYRQQINPDLSYLVGGTLGVQTFRSKSESVFPTDPGLQSQLAAASAAGGTIAARYGGNHEIGPAGGARAEVDYRVNDRLHIGGKIGFDRAGNFTEGAALVYARYVFATPN